MLKRLVLNLVRHVVFMYRTPIFVSIMGGPGAGKGTVAQTLAPELGLTHLSTGALMRRQVELKTPVGQAIEKIMKSGKLVPDPIVFALLREELERPANWRGAILDGFPRTRAQAEWLSAFFPKWNTRLTAAIQLDVPEADIIERLSGRRTCSNSKCGATYHIKFNPPKREGICDVCSSELTRRADDDPAVIRKRLEEYRAAHGPVLEHFRMEGSLVAIQATNASTPAQVLAQVKAAVLQRV